MSFVSFLKKAGTIIANIAAVEAGLEPIVKNMVPTADQPVVDKLNLIFQSVVATEGQFAAAYPTAQTGPQKLLAAASLVGPILGTIDLIKGVPIANQADYEKAIQTITGGVADLLNALQAKAGNNTAASVVAAPAAAVMAGAPTKTPNAG